MTGGEAQGPGEAKASDQQQSKSTWWPQFWLVVISAVAAAVTTLGANVFMQGWSFLHEQEKVTKKERAEVYLRFLGAADSYVRKLPGGGCRLVPSTYLPETGNSPTEVQELRERQIAMRERIAQAKKSGECDPTAVAAFTKVSVELERAYNRVYFYGSSDAIDAADRVLSALNIPHYKASFGQVDSQLYAIDRKAYLHAYSRFRDIVHCEVPAKDRPSCLQ